MSLDVTIHTAQVSILRELLFVPSASYATLQKPTGFTSDHFQFHINRLLELGLVEKVQRGEYRLSAKGKEYANKLDTDNNTVERQPKIAVILGIENTDGRWLCQERLKNPYYGFWGFASGKIRWGETILETAARELDEETGLQADVRIAGVYHEIVAQTENKELLEDKIFFVIHCTNIRGQLKETFEGGRNLWMLPNELLAKKKLYDSVKIEFDMVRSTQAIQDVVVERHTNYSKDQF